MLDTPRTNMSVYMESVKNEHGYRSLKAKYQEMFPTPGGAANYGVLEQDSYGEEDILPINPIEEKNCQIMSLKKSLE